MNPRTTRRLDPGRPAPAAKRPFAAGQRPTEIGPFGATQPGTGRTRRIPAPWIDCELCAWRHYPSTSGGRWEIATDCVSCGAPLQPGADHTDDL